MRSLIPEVAVRDVEATAEFYGKVLGFQTLRIIGTGSGGDITAWLRRGEVEIIFRSGDAPERKGVVFHFYVNDIHALYERVSEHGIIEQDLQTSLFGAREFSIVDIDDRVLHFIEPDALEGWREGTGGLDGNAETAQRGA